MTMILDIDIVGVL